jgi:hypothetical protein
MHTAWLGGGMSNQGVANGVACVGSDILTFFCAETCQDDRRPAGHTIPEVGPYPFTESGFGGTYSQRCSGATSGLTHELGSSRRYQLAPVQSCGGATIRRVPPSRSVSGKGEPGTGVRAPVDGSRLRPPTPGVDPEIAQP